MSKDGSWETTMTMTNDDDDELVGARSVPARQNLRVTLFIKPWNKSVEARPEERGAKRRTVRPSEMR